MNNFNWSIDCTSHFTPYTRGQGEKATETLPQADSEPESKRTAIGRWNSMAGDEIHPDRWRNAYGNPINQDLRETLETVQAQSQHEFQTSPFYRGVVRTYAMHVCGPQGPTLQVQSDNKQFNELVEKHWKKVFKKPDPAANMSGVDSIRLSVIQLLLAGSTLNVHKATRRQGPVKFGWQTVHPRKLKTPSSMAGDAWVFSGIHFNRDGSRKEYFFEQQEGVVGGSGLVKHDPKPLPADLVDHIYMMEEGEQATGAPLMGSANKVSSEIREYDADVMESAKSAARMSILLHAVHPDAVEDYDPIPEKMVVNRGGVTRVPVGHEASGMASTQPMSKYVEFRHERLAELGRAIHMPLMLVLLSSQGSNFSSAQFDGTIYADGVAETQFLIQEKGLEPLVEQVIIELVLNGLTERPDEYELQFKWPKPPHANIEKITKALRMQLEDGSISLIEYCAILGWDHEAVLKNRQRVDILLEELGLPPVLVGAKREDPEELNGNSDEEEDDSKPADKKDDDNERNFAEVLVGEGAL